MVHHAVEHAAAAIADHGGTAGLRFHYADAEIFLGRRRRSALALPTVARSASSGR